MYKVASYGKTANVQLAFQRTKQHTVIISCVLTLDIIKHLDDDIHNEYSQCLSAKIAIKIQHGMKNRHENERCY